MTENTLNLLQGNYIEEKVQEVFFYSHRRFWKGHWESIALFPLNEDRCLCNQEIFGSIDANDRIEF